MDDNNPDHVDDVVPTKPDVGWAVVPPIGTPHNPPADPEFTVPPAEEAEGSV